MTRRYSRTLKDHIRIAEEHAEKLVKRLVYNAKKAKYYREKGLYEKELEVFHKMVELTDELKPVEKWVKENWLPIGELYDAVQKCKNNAEEKVDEAN